MKSKKHNVNFLKVKKIEDLLYSVTYFNKETVEYMLIEYLNTPTKDINSYLTSFLRSSKQNILRDVSIYNVYLNTEKTINQLSQECTLSSVRIRQIVRKCFRTVIFGYIKRKNNIFSPKTQP